MGKESVLCNSLYLKPNKKQVVSFEGDAGISVGYWCPLEATLRDAAVWQQQRNWNCHLRWTCREWSWTQVCNLVLLFSWFVGENAKEDLQGKKSLSEKVSLYRGDITLLEVDAIVNAGRWLNILPWYVLKILYSAMLQTWTSQSSDIKLVCSVEICWKLHIFPQFLCMTCAHPVCLYCDKDYCAALIAWSPRIKMVLYPYFDLPWAAESLHLVLEEAEFWC